MSEHDLDYARDLRIDQTALDTEWLKQPGLYMRYAEAAAEAERDRDQLKQASEALKAELDPTARRTIEASGAKVTESAVTAWIGSNQELRAARERLGKAEFRVSILKEAVRAFDHRKAALTNLVTLWQGSYFAGPKAPRDISVSNDALENVSEKQTTQLNRKRRP